MKRDPWRFKVDFSPENFPIILDKHSRIPSLYFAVTLENLISILVESRENLINIFKMRSKISLSFTKKTSRNVISILQRNPTGFN